MSQPETVVVSILPDDAEPDPALLDEHMDGSDESLGEETTETENPSLEIVRKHFPSIDVKSLNIPEGYRFKCHDDYPTLLQLEYSTTNKDEVESWHLVGGAILNVGLARDEQDGQWSTVVLFRNRDKKIKQFLFRQSQLITASSFSVELVRSLVDAGYFASSSLNARKSLCKYLNVAGSRRMTLTARTGWHGSTFVLPDRNIGKDQFVLTESAPTKAPSGTLDQWRDSISKPSAGNTRLQFAIAVAFTSPVLRCIGGESGGFHIVGTSSQGKTVAGSASASVWSFGIQRWHATQNAIETNAASASDMGMVLDEMSQADPRSVGQIAYMLANQQGKHRSTASGDNREVKTWELGFLSTGEQSLAALSDSVGASVQTGQELRIVDIEANAGKGLGLFDCLPNGCDDPATFADDMTTASKQYTGTAGPAFIEYLVANQSTVKAILNKRIKSFLEKYVEPNYAGQVHRVARRFAIVAAAGELATQAGITGWQTNESTTAAAACFKSWLLLWGSTTSNKESQKAIDQVATFITQNESRFDPLESGGNSTTVTPNRAGYIKDGNTDPDCRYWLILPEVFNKEVCRGLSPSTVKKALNDIKQIQRDSNDKFSIPYTPGSTRSKQRFVVIYDTVKSMSGDS